MGGKVDQSNRRMVFGPGTVKLRQKRLYINSVLSVVNVFLTRVWVINFKSTLHVYWGWSNNMIDIHEPGSSLSGELQKRGGCGGSQANPAV